MTATLFFLVGAVVVALCYTAAGPFADAFVREIGRLVREDHE